MKKFIIATAALLLAAAGSAHAQLGIIGGVTSSSTNLTDAYNDIANAQSVTQYHAGIVYKLNLPLGLYAQTGVVYDMKGDALSTQLYTQEVNINTKTGYLEVPVQVGMQFDLSSMIGVFGFVEPFLGYAITTETKTEFENSTSQKLAETLASAAGVELNTTDENKWNGRERIQYGVGVGAGVMLFDRVSLSAKYYWNLGNMYNEDGSSAISVSTMYEATKDQKCSGIMASLTLYF